MKVTTVVAISTCAIFAALWNAQSAQVDQDADLQPNKSTKVTIYGYVRDVARWAGAQLLGPIKSRNSQVCLSATFLLRPRGLGRS